MEEMEDGTGTEIAAPTFSRIVADLADNLTRTVPTRSAQKVGQL